MSVSFFLSKFSQFMDLTCDLVHKPEKSSSNISSTWTHTSSMTYRDPYWFFCTSAEQGQIMGKYQMPFLPGTGSTSGQQLQLHVSADIENPGTMK